MLKDINPVLLERAAGMVAGIVLALVAVSLSGVVHDSAVSVVFAVGGVGLVAYAILWDRLESLGPAGLKLRVLIDRAARHFEVADTLPTIEESVAATVTRAGSGQAAAAIRAAQTPEQLIDTLVDLIERPESRAERASRVEKDDEQRTIRRRYGPGPTDTGAR